MTGIALNSDYATGENGRATTARTDLKIAVAALLAVIAMQFPLIWQRAINWDEFFHYSQLEALANGTLTSPLQSLQARLFIWVRNLPGSGIDHIITIRFAMFGFELVAAAMIASIAARFTDRIVGILCAIAYIGGGFVFQHGFSFRTDPMVAALLMSSLWLLLCSRLRIQHILICGFLVGLATMISIKTILFAPAFMGVAWLQWSQNQRSIDWLYRLAAIGAVSVFSFAAIYMLHTQDLAAESSEAAKGVVQASANKMFGLGSLPFMLYGLKQALLAPALTIIILLFPAELLRSRLPVNERLALAGMFAPLLTLFFYHNTAPYYYTFMLPPVIAASSIAVVKLRQKFGAALVAGLLVFTTSMLWLKEGDGSIRSQRILVAAAQQMFPEGVNYFDFCAFLSPFPKANTFMTPWGIELYKAGYYPTLSASMDEKPVPLVMDNDPMFTRLLSTDAPVPEFLPSDAAAIRETYIHFWGPYWIAGKKIVASKQAQYFNVRVPGPYTVRGAGVTVDGKFYSADSVIILNRRIHEIGPGDVDTKLVWGRHISPPSQPAPAEPFWTPF